MNVTPCCGCTTFPDSVSIKSLYDLVFAFPDEPLLLASVQSELLLLGVHSSSLHLLSSASRPVFSLDYHWAQQRVYWLSPDYQSIRWADMKNSSNRGTLIKGNAARFRGKHECDLGPSGSREVLLQA